VAGIDNLTPFTPDDDRASKAGQKGGSNKKGSKHINTWIQELLQDEDFAAKIRIGYEIQDFKGAPIQAIIKAQMIKAVEGDTKAFDSLAKYGWSQKIETDITSGGEKIDFNASQAEQLIRARAERLNS
jgi:hypothetical protein